MGFEEAASVIGQWVDEEIVPGAAVEIVFRGERVASVQAGEAQPGVPVREDTLFALASVSKPFTVAAVMHAIDEGHFDLDDAVSTVLPDFGHIDDPFADDAIAHLEAERDNITFRHLLSHTSGLPENAGIKRIRTADLPTLAEQVAIMLNVPLASPPGERLRYSNLDIAIAAHAAEVATGTPIHTLIQQAILDPLALDGIALTPGPDLDDRIAIVQDPSNEGSPAESYNSRWWRDNGITWGGYFGTPGDVLRFALSFLPGRESPLSDASRQEMITDQANGADGGVESLGAIWSPGFWGLGWEVRGEKRRHWTGETSDASTFCHWGQAGTLVWVDPTRDLGVAIFANRTVRKPWPLRPPRWMELSDAIIAVADAEGR